MADGPQAGRMQQLLEAFQRGPDGEYLPATPLVFFMADPRVLAWGLANRPSGTLDPGGMGSWMRLLNHAAAPPEQHGAILEIPLARMKERGMAPTGSARLLLQERIEDHYRHLGIGGGFPGIAAHRERLLALAESL